MSSWTTKRKQTEANNTDDTSGDALLITSLREFITILVNFLQTLWSVFTTPLIINLAIEEHMHQVENTINNIGDIVRQVLEILVA